MQAVKLIGRRCDAPSRPQSACSYRVGSWRVGRPTHQCRIRCIVNNAVDTSQRVVKPENEIPGMTEWLDSLKWGDAKLVAVIAQHADTGEVLMQAFADRDALNETLQTRLATFYSRSRGGRWCKGETSGHYLQVLRVFFDCDKDSIVYLCDPIGPACHTGAPTCWFSEVSMAEDGVTVAEACKQPTHRALTTLQGLEQIIQTRKEAMGREDVKPSWTAKLIRDETLLCKKIREEAGELCQTLEANEGKERTASEMADLLYHAMVLLNVQDVAMEDVLRVLRQRFGTSGIDEKASRKK